MLKHLAHSHHGKLHTFDDFYRNDSKPLKTPSSTGEVVSTGAHSLSSSPSSPCSPNSHPYTFYNVFSDFKSSTTPDVVLEEDETEEENDGKQESVPSTPVFYLEDDQHQQQQQSQQQQHHCVSSSSPHWPSALFNRFRHPHHGLTKQNSVNENQMYSTKLRKHELSESSANKHQTHRFLKRSETINNASGIDEKKSSNNINDDFPELSAPSHSLGKKHRSFVSLLHHFHHPHHPNFSSTNNVKHGNKSNSTGTLHTENSHPTLEHTRHKLLRQKTLPSTNEINASVVVSKSPSTPILPKLASLFHRHHHVSEQYTYRVGNLKARLHHRKRSPALGNLPTKFQCQSSNELIDRIKHSEEHADNDETDHHLRSQRSVKPVVMKRVHTWHNTFDLRPVDQCLEY